MKISIDQMWTNFLKFSRFQCQNTANVTFRWGAQHFVILNFIKSENYSEDQSRIRSLFAMLNKFIVPSTFRKK